VTLDNNEVFWGSVLWIIVCPFGHCIVYHCLSLWSLYCLSLFVPLVIVLSIIVCPFGHCIVYHCLSLWSLYCLSLFVPLVIVLSIIVCPFCHCIVYHCLSLWSLYCLSFFDLKLRIQTFITMYLKTTKIR
jgi:hypothetical protein